jgi:hypothetical protein
MRLVRRADAGAAPDGVELVRADVLREVVGLIHAGQVFTSLATRSASLLAHPSAMSVRLLQAHALQFHQFQKLRDVATFLKSDRWI